MKPRINVYLDDHVADQLALISKRPGVNKSRIVSEALDRFFNPEKFDETSGAMIRRLDRMSGALDRLDRKLDVGVETLALFIRYFLTITPPLADADQAAAHALGRERFEIFVAQVGRRLAQDKNLLRDVLETITEKKPDLFAVDTLTLDRAMAESSENQTEIETADDEFAVDDDLPPLRPVIVVDGDDGADPDLFDTDLDDLEYDDDWKDADVHQR